MNLYRLFWDDFASWYLEIVKPGYKKAMDKMTYEATVDFFERLMKLLHPFMPFITEEIWHLIKERDEKDCIIVSELPRQKTYDSKLVDSFEIVKEVITSIRSVRKEKEIPNKETLELNYNGELNNELNPVITKLANVSSINKVEGKMENVVSFMVRTTEFYIPLEGHVDAEEEIKKLEEELNYTKGFLNSVMKKLSNEKFVQNAPEKVVNMEKKKKEDAESKIKTLEERIKSLKG
jgi:valyl-tRNA synthetase